MDFETAQICLNSNNAIENTDRTSFTWNNINLRNALGEMYDKYDLYNLILNVVVNDNCAVGYNASDSDRQALIRLSGLPFKNFTYNTKLQSSGVILGNYTYPTSGLSQRYYTSDSFTTFSKNQDICSITIDMLRISDLTLCKPTNTNAFPEMVFWFSIYGIDKDKGNLNGSRIEVGKR